MNKKRLMDQLCLHEGVELTPYTDTEGNQTVLVGYNVTARGWDLIEKLCGKTSGLTREDAFKVLRADVDRLLQACPVMLPLFAELDEVRQRVLVDLAFNIGSHVLGFKKMIAALGRKDWSAATKELHSAHWATQVQPGVDIDEDAAKLVNSKIRGRADRLGYMLLTGLEAPDIPDTVPQQFAA